MTVAKKLMVFQILCLFLLACDSSVVRLKAEDFPELELVKLMTAFRVLPDDKYHGLFEHKKGNAIFSNSDANSVQNTYEYLLESFECCGELIKNSDELANSIVRFSGDVQHMNVSLWVYDDFFEISVNPSPKLMISNKFRLPEDRTLKLQAMLGFVE